MDTTIPNKNSFFYYDGVQFQTKACNTKHFSINQLGVSPFVCMPTTDSVYTNIAGHIHQYSNWPFGPRIFFRTGELISNAYGTLLPAVL